MIDSIAARGIGKCNLSMPLRDQSALIRPSTEKGNKNTNICHIDENEN